MRLMDHFAAYVHPAEGGRNYPVVALNYHKLWDNLPAVMAALGLPPELEVGAAWPFINTSFRALTFLPSSKVASNACVSFSNIYSHNSLRLALAGHFSKAHRDRSQ